MCQIEFLQADSTRGLVPEPYPASRHVPEWFKNLPADNEHGATLKRCPPFLEAMTAGYIIPAPGDLRVTMNADGFAAWFGQWQYLSLHNLKEYEGAPFQDGSIVKFHNPWIIVTPPGYVCLITAPINRFEMPFVAITGIVETDTFYKQVGQPMVSTMRPGDTFDLRQGAPLIQVIPFQRREWTSRLGIIDNTRLAEQQTKLDANSHTYKDEIWRKLHFS